MTEAEVDGLIGGSWGSIGYDLCELHGLELLVAFIVGLHTGLDWIEQDLTSPPTQCRLSGRQEEEDIHGAHVLRAYIVRSLSIRRVDRLRSRQDSVAYLIVRQIHPHHLRSPPSVWFTLTETEKIEMETDYIRFASVVFYTDLHILVCGFWRAIWAVSIILTSLFVFALWLSKLLPEQWAFSDSE